MSGQREHGRWEEFSFELDATFRRAANDAPVVKTMTLGERRIALHFAHQDVSDQLSAALAGLDDAASTVAPDSTIVIWEGSRAPVEPPRPPWFPEDIGPRGEILGLDSPRFRAAFNLDSRTLSFADRAARRGHFLMQSAADLPDYERAAPLRTLLAWVVEDWGFQFVHAACVARAGRGVLFAGKGGSGKSTCALACLGTDLEYVADDYCVLSLARDRPDAYGVYTTGKLEHHHLSLRLPALSARASSGAGDKAILYLDPESLRALAAPVSLEALILPKVVSNGEARLERCSTAFALTALAPSSVFQIPGLGAKAFRFLAEVARRLPCYSLTLGSDLGDVLRTVRTLLH